MATLAHCISLHSLSPQIAVRIEDVRKQYIKEGHPAQVATERAVIDIIGQAQAQLDEVVLQINDKIASDYPALIKGNEPAKSQTIDDEINDISMDDLGAMFDEADKPPEQERTNAKPKAPRKEAKAEAPSVKKNTAKDIVADAAKSGVEGLEEAANGLYALFGGGDSTLMSFPAGFNQDTYAAAKPHFATALQKFKEAGQGLREFVAFVRDKFGAGAKMYLMNFVQDMKDGILDKNGNVVKLEGESKLEGGQDNVPNNSAELPAGEQTEPGRGPEKSSESGSGNGGREGSEDNGENDQGEIAGQPGKPTGDKAGAEDSQGDSNQRNDRLPQQPLDYSITDDDALGKGGAKTKARQNIAAIKIVKKLIEENRQATKEEQAALVKYVGWGASELANGLFPVRTAWDAKSKKFLPVYKEGWESLGKQVRGLLTDEEYEQAKASTVNAHYTSPEVIRSMYAALEQMGFKGGRILEPGSGIGNFLGLLPESLKGNTFTAVEMDAISAAISKYLYPSHDIRHQDFTQTILPDNFFDVAIGNPPFSDTKILSDPRYAKKKFALHDYFFAKTMDKVRPGGLMILVTSRYTMDKTDDKARAYLSKQADFLGAIRLPQTAFKQNAGTDVVTDVIFLRKRVDGEQPAGEAWGELAPVRINKKSVHINQYFASNPGMILGTNSLEGSMYGAQQYTVKPKRGKQLGELFQETIKKLPRDLYEKEDPGTASAEDSLEADFAPSNVKEGAFYLDKKGTLLNKQNGVGVKSKATGINKKKIIAFIGIRDAVRNVLYVQLKGHDDAELKAAQTVMEKHYDAFVKKFGHLNTKKVSTSVSKAGKTITRTTYPNLQPFRKTDPEAYLVASIEEYNEDTLEATKGDIFTKRVIDPQVEPDIESIEDALNVSLARLGKIDIADIAKLMNIPEEDAIAGLGDSIFFNPTKGGWETDDEYLQGNVKEKLAQAQAAAMVDKKFDKNVKALEEIQPEDLPPSKTPVNLGMPIVTPDDLIKFAREMFDGDLQISHNALLGTWNVENSNGRISVAATTDFGTSRVPAHELLTSALNSKTVVVKDTVPDGSGGTRQVVAKGATIAANVKLEQLKKRFKDWIWEDNDRAAYYTKVYNERYNVFVKQHTNSAFIKAMTFPGVSASVHPYEHQKRIAWRIIQKGNTYMAHSVGAGKTIGSILAGMELKRLGIKKKPMWVVPNHMLKQFAAEFYELYPAARLLIADESQFSRTLRQKFIGKIATGNWDGIIITHAAFKKIPLSAQFQADMINEQIEEYAEAYRDAQGDRLKRKKLEAALRKLREKLARIMNDVTADRGVTFEESGIDQLFVDEAHEFRKLMFATNQGDMKGVDPNGSNMAFDLFMKIRYLESLTPNRSAVFMSGTPITNTLGEVFSIQRMLQLPLLKQLGLDRFDAWASTFATTTTQPEAQPSGNYKVVTRLGEFQNLETLVGMWADVGDYVHAKDLHYITRPRIKGGSRKMVVADETEVLAQYRSSLGERIRAIENRSGPPQKGDDIILSVITDGRHAALDDRFINPTLQPNPNGKLEKMIGNVFDIWKRTKENKSTQMIFADEGLPQAFEKRGFSPYLEIKRRLIEMGVPEEEIAFMQDFKKSEEKRKLFNRVNNGDVRVLIGSSQAMGTGVNAQDRLFALHHLDADRYLPAMIEQREGRIIRQGNSNEEIEIYAYITKGSMDENMWQFLESKQRFIDQFLAGNATVSTTEDIDKGSNLFALAKAMASNNPLILEKATIENQIMRLEALHRSFIDSKHAMLGEAKRAERRIPDAEAAIKTLEKAIASRVSTKGDKFKMVFDGKEYTDRKEAGEALLKKVFSGKVPTSTRQIGSLGGFPLKIYTNANDGSLITYYLDSDGFRVHDKSFFTDIKSLYEDQSPIGLVMSMENSVRGLDGKIEAAKEFIEQADKKIADAKAREKATFEYADELKEKEARLKAINDELAATPPEQPAAVPATQSTDTEQPTAQSDTSTPSFSRKKLDASADKGLTGKKGGVKYGNGRTTKESRRLQEKIERYLKKSFPSDSYQEVELLDDYDDVSRRIGKVFGRRIVYFTVADKEAHDFNGVIFPDDPKTIYINVNGDHHAVTILGHEMLHSMKQTSPALYEKLRKVALAEMYQDEFARYHLDLAKKRADDGELNTSHEQTYEEMIADFIGDQFADGTFWSKVAVREPGIFEQVVKFVQRYIKKILGKMKLYGLNSSAYFRDVKKVQDAAAEALSEFIDSEGREAQQTGAVVPQPLFSRRGNEKGNDPGDEQGKKANAIVDAVTGGPDTARDIEEDRLFTMKIFEYRDLAQKKANNIAVQIEQQIQRMAGSTRKWKGPLAYNRLKDSTKARQLSEAMMVYRDLKRDPATEQVFRNWAKEQLHSGTLGKVETRKLQEKIDILDLASNLSQEQKDFVDNDVDELFKAVGERAQATGLVNTLLDNYVRRLWTLPDKKKFTGLANGYGFKVWTTASKQRTLNTILDGWMAGYDLKVKGIHNSYDQIAREIAGIEANLAFIISGKKTKDLDGHSLFTTSNLDGYEELKAPGFGVWVASGKVAGGPLATDEDGNLTDDSFLLEVNTFGQKVFVAPPDGRNESTIYEKRQLKAPKQLADMINKVTARDDFFSSTPFMDKASKFNRITKGWILLSSFFHHLAGSRSWVFGVHHGTKINPVTAYKRGLKKIEGMHPIVQLGIKNGLTYGLRQDFDEAYFTDDTVFEQIFKRLDMDKALKGAEWVKQKRNSFTNSLFKQFFAGLKAEAFVVEFTHELNKDKSQDQDRLAERIATLINADFGGLHLKRMGRNPTLQGFARLLLLAPDWCLDSTTRAMTKTGWKYHHELQIGVDEILAFNPDTKKYQWSKLNDMYVNSSYNGPMVKIKNHSRAILMTPDHKCYAYNSSTKRYDIVLAKDLNTAHQIPRCADYGFPETETFSDIFVELVGWLFTDGYIKKSEQDRANGETKEYRYGKITQSKPKTVQRLKNLGLTYYIKKKSSHGKFKDNYTPYIFNIPVETFREMEALGIDRKLNWDFLCKLTKRQMKLLFDVMQLADGANGNRFAGRENSVFFMTLIQTLLGKPSTFWQQEENCWRTRHVEAQGIGCWGHHNNKTEIDYKGTIWCPSVDTGFWLAEREGLMFITGNTESNFRTVTGMIPGMNKAISKLMGELPPPPGMDKLYRHFWGRVIFASVVSTLIPQLLLNAWTPDDRDDLLDFYREQVFHNFRRLRWTAVDITKLYHVLGVDIPDNQRKTFSIVGHFADPLKILDIDRLIKGKGSPIVRIADNLFSGTDWAKRPYTGVKELAKTHKTVKKSRYQKTENVFSRLPSAIIGSAKGVLPIQANELISYLMGEQDGWSALFTSAGAHPSNTYTPDIVGDRYKELRSNVLRVEREAKALRLGKDQAGAKKLIIKEFGNLANFYALKHLYVVTRTGLTPLNKRLKILREGKKMPRRAERIEKMKSAIANKQQKFIDRYQKVQ